MTAESVRELGRHTHFSVPVEYHKKIIADSDAWIRQDFHYVYWDYEDLRLLLQDALWLRVRNGKTYEFLRSAKDVTVVEKNGTLDGEPEMRSIMQRTVLLACVIRYTHKITPNIWVDFATFTDGDDDERQHFDCFATRIDEEHEETFDFDVCGERRHGGDANALQHFKEYDAALSVRPDHWPLPKQHEPASREVIEFYASILQEEFTSE